MDNITRKANKRVHDLRSDSFEEQNKEYTEGYDCDECFEAFMRKLEWNISQTLNSVNMLEIVGDNKKTNIEDEALKDRDSNFSEKFVEDQDVSNNEMRSNGMYNISDGDSMYNEENSDSDKESLDEEDYESIKSIENEDYPRDINGNVNKRFFLTNEENYK